MISIVIFATNYHSGKKIHGSIVKGVRFQFFAIKANSKSFALQETLCLGRSNNNQWDKCKNCTKRNEN